MKEIPKVLFICVANAGKSQMAEAIARAKYATQFIALSAGTNPKTTTNALAAKSVAEIGASMDSASPKPIAPHDSPDCRSCCHHRRCRSCRAPLGRSRLTRALAY